MKKIIKGLWISLIIGFSINVIASPNSDIGTVVGGIAGGLLGNQLGHGSSRGATTIGGAVVGSLVGNQMGRNADHHPQVTYYNSPPQHSHWGSSVHSTRPVVHTAPRVAVHSSAPVSPLKHYRNSFINKEGRLCRHTLLKSSFGDHFSTVYCCYGLSSKNICTRWVKEG